MNGVWKNLGPQFVHDFRGFEKADEESKEVFSNVVTLNEKLGLDLQEDDFIELLAVQHEELTNEDLMELEAQRKDEERQEEEVTEEPKRFTMQEMARGFSLFKEALLVFEAQDPNVERYTKVAAAVQNAIQCYRVIYDEKKRATTQTSLDHFFKEGIGSSNELSPARNQNLCHQRQAWVKLQLALRLLLLTILQLYHLPPPLPPPVSNSSCLFTRSQPLYASCCTVLLYFSRYCPVRLKMFSLFFVFVF